MTSSQTIVLITGANQGVGYETAKNLLLSSPTYHVLLGSRDPTKGAAAVSALRGLPNLLGTVDPLTLDVTSDASVDAAAAEVAASHGRLDTLVNNAGIFSKNPVARDAFREILAVNAVGVVSVTEAFLSLLRKSSSPRLVLISSSVGSITHAADPTSKYYNPSANEYRASKAAVNMLLVQYSNRLGKEGMKVIGADPGLIATNFVNAEQVRKRGAMEPEVGGERVATVVKGVRHADLGRVCGEYGVSPW